MLQDQLRAIIRDIKTSMCEHKELEHDMDFADGYPIWLGTVCLECGKDIELSAVEIQEACDDAAEDVVSSRIDQALDEWKDRYND